jgi:hypothetical protein
MFFVVYQVKNGKCVSVYEREGSAKAQVTRNNKALMTDILRGENRGVWWQDRKVEWAYCSYTDYKPHFYKAYKAK